MSNSPVERKSCLPWRDKLYVGSTDVLSYLFLLGTLIPGYALLGARMPLWLAALLPVGIFYVAINLLSVDTWARSRKLLRAWAKQNPELHGRLKEVMAQAPKDPDGIGFFGHALQLIQRDPDRAVLLEGMFFLTTNKTQLRLALCREWHDGMSPELTWAFDSRIRVANHTDLGVLLGIVYAVMTASYLVGGLLYWHWSKTGELLSPLINSLLGHVWLALPTAIAFMTILIKVSSWFRSRPKGD